MHRTLIFLSITLQTQNEAKPIYRTVKLSAEVKKLWKNLFMKSLDY